MLPQDDFILLSYLNAKLRDFTRSFRALRRSTSREERIPPSARGFR
ncbi:MAG: DUF4250 family protein [Candidatus Borkfalkia sp.]